MLFTDTVFQKVCRFINENIIKISFSFHFNLKLVPSNIFLRKDKHFLFHWRSNYQDNQYSQWSFLPSMQHNGCSQLGLPYCQRILVPFYRTYLDSRKIFLESTFQLWDIYLILERCKNFIFNFLFCIRLERDVRLFFRPEQNTSLDQPTRCSILGSASEHAKILAILIVCRISAYNLSWINQLYKSTNCFFFC